MCLVRVRDEDEHVVPVRIRRPSPQRVRVERTSVVRNSRSEFGPLPSSVPPAKSRPDIPPPSVAPRPASRAPSARSRTRSAYVEVDEEDSSSESEVSRHTSHTRKTSKSRRTAPASEYSVHEREVRRERGYSRPREEYETYRYVDAPRARSRSGAARSSYTEPRRSSRDGRAFGDVEVDYRRTSRGYR